MDEKIKKTILKILLSAGLLSKKQTDEILLKEEQARARLLKSKGTAVRRGRLIQPDISIIDIIDSLKFKMPGSDTAYITEEVIMQEIAKHLKMPFLKIDPLRLDSDIVTKVISKPYAIKHQLVPIKLSDNILTVATSNPFEREGVDGIKQSKGYDIEVAVSTKADILKIITEFYGFKISIAAAHDELTSQIDLGNLEQYVKLKSVSELAASDQHIIDAVEYLLHYAYSQRASDIHIEPKREHSLVRFRIDGVLHDIHRMPKAVHPAFVSRIKTLSRMDIAEKRRPQDGRIKTDQDGKEIELRVSTLPVAFGEKVVIRIFDPAVLMQDIDKLGFLERESALFRSFISAPYGLILVTGPTGSGKTTTLYSALRTLSTSDINLTTIEDPVEMIYEDFNQTSIHPQIGITFASSLRTILRQDPDIIMVGEIRDIETADNAIQAALTGHLVLSTLHTNDAPGTVTRLLDIGIQPFLINSTLVGIVAQRLVRKVCQYCADRYYLSEDECKMLGIHFDRAKNIKVSIGVGCPQCRGTGYLGRAGIFEVMEITEKIRAAVEEKATPVKIRQLAKSEGFTSLRECAIEKMFKGITTFDEIIRVTGIIG
ncbi:MAG: type II/IV secretion system protein [Nitrospirae bacterium]|nr:type II/IV secretion system protein [Nitrospirota bacterium]